MTERAVICIDGPSGSGKGTLARRLAIRLSWAYLDSGALYRLLALRTVQLGLADEAAAAAAGDMQVRFALEDNGVWLNEQPVAAEIRTEDVGAIASRLAARPEVRAALLSMQRQFAAPQSLVADGRDMGTVVFPDAPCKVFLEASARIRAQRRVEELRAVGKNAKFDRIYSDICERDARDRSRTTAPLRPAPDALLLDSSEMTAEAVLEAALAHLRQCGLG